MMMGSKAHPWEVACTVACAPVVGVCVDLFVAGCTHCTHTRHLPTASTFIIHLWRFQGGCIICNAYIDEAACKLVLCNHSDDIAVRVVFRPATRVPGQQQHILFWREALKGVDKAGVTACMLACQQQNSAYSLDMECQA